MAQVRQGRFAVSDTNDIDIDLVELPGYNPVIIEKEHREYSDDFESEISELEAGDIILAQIQSEDILTPNSIWRFVEFKTEGHDPGWSVE